MANEKGPDIVTVPEVASARPPEARVVDSTRVQVETIAQPKREILLPKDFVNEVLTPREMTLGKVQEISDFFRWIFTNDWNQYAVCTSCEEDLKKEVRMSAPEAFKSKEHIPLEQIDDPKNLPSCPCCSKQMKWFHDPEATRLNMKRKLLDYGDGFATLIRHPSDGKVAGFSFGYGSTLRQEFESEWANRYLYMKEPPHKAGRDLEELIESLNYSFPEKPFTSESKVFAWNCMALAPKARFGVLLGSMMRDFFNSIPSEKRDLMIVGEAIKGSPAHKIFKTVGGRDVEGFIEEPETIIAGNLGRVADTFNLPADKFAELKKAK